MEESTNQVSEILISPTSFNVNRLRTGDLLFFHTDVWPATVIQYACHSYWCHIALVVFASKNELGIGQSSSSYDNDIKRLYIFESSTFAATSPCVMGDKYHSGVRLVELMPRLNQSGKIGVLQLKFVKKYQSAPSTSNQANLQENTINFIRRETGKHYEENLNNLIWAWWHSIACINCCNRDNIEDTSSYFCSELIAEILSQTGVIKSRTSQDKHGDLHITNFPSSNFTVTDFENPNLLNQKYINTADFKYSEMKYIHIGIYVKKRRI